ncbi:hypothetical protein MAR_036363 [Mya arenaria]|uniref:Uncharacterized protein n=1 Tax=Mya arenaria TaxID=6604 RepID=A0ABY7FMZ9_MYAAR|nr:hypothetical protein MAR_036363 [Mya arenaria]
MDGSCGKSYSMSHDGTYLRSPNPVPEGFEPKGATGLYDQHPENTQDARDLSYNREVLHKSQDNATFGDDSGFCDHHYDDSDPARLGSYRTPPQLTSYSNEPARCFTPCSFYQLQPSSYEHYHCSTPYRMAPTPHREFLGVSGGSPIPTAEMATKASVPGTAPFLVYNPWRPIGDPSPSIVGPPVFQMFRPLPEEIPTPLQRTIHADEPNANPSSGECKLGIPTSCERQSSLPAIRSNIEHSALVSLLNRAPLYENSAQYKTVGSTKSWKKPEEVMNNRNEGYMKGATFYRPSLTNYTKAINELNETETNAPVKPCSPQLLAYSDISDTDGSSNVDTNNNTCADKLTGKYSEGSETSSSDHSSGSDTSSDELDRSTIALNTVNVRQRRIRRRKSQHPVRSAARFDPRFKGATVWLQTSYEKGISKLQLSAFYR